MTRRGRRLTAVLLVAVVALPGLVATIDDGHDSYPLSSYPMFARARPESTVLVGAVVVNGDGEERRLSPGEVSGTPEPLQATALVRRALDSESDELCRTIATRVGRLAPGERLLLVRDRVDAVGFYANRGSNSVDRVTELDCTGDTG